MIGYLWLQLWLKNHCKITRYYSIFQLSLSLLLNYYQYNCNKTISSVSVYVLWVLNSTAGMCNIMPLLSRTSTARPAWHRKLILNVLVNMFGRHYAHRKQYVKPLRNIVTCDLRSWKVNGAGIAFTDHPEVYMTMIGRISYLIFFFNMQLL